MRRQIEFEILPEFYIFLSVMIFILPLPWLCAAIFAGFLHELGHYLSLKACKIPVYRISLRSGGARMETGPMSSLQSFLCASAGPFAGGLLFLLFPVMPRVAVCGLLQTAYNVLPFPDFDGSRVLSGVLAMLVGDNRAKQILPGISIAALLIIALVLFRVHLVIGLAAVILILCKFRKLKCIHLTKKARVLN